LWGLGEGGGVTEKNYLYWGGVMGKNLITEGGSCNFLMTLQKIPPAPPFLVKNERSLRGAILEDI